MPKTKTKKLSIVEKSKQKIKGVKSLRINPLWLDISANCIKEKEFAFIRRKDGSLALVWVQELLFTDKGIEAIVRGTTQETVGITRQYPTLQLIPVPYIEPTKKKPETEIEEPQFLDSPDD